MPLSESLARCKTALQDRALVLPSKDASRAAVPWGLCGVSIDYLELFAERIQQDPLADVVSDSYSLVQRVLLPLLSKYGKKTRMWDIIPKEHLGPPSYYIVHCWQDNFADMVSTLSAMLASSNPEAESSEDQVLLELTSPRSKPKVFVWLDIFAIDQQPCSPGTPLDLRVVRDAIASSRLGVVVVMDQQQQLLTRAWCLYEVLVGAYYGSFERLQVALPAGYSIPWVRELQEACRQADISRAPSSKPEDRTSIMREVKHGCGLKRSNSIIREALLRSVHVRLRFSGDRRDLATHAALLLQAREYSQLQALLGGIPELQDDDAALQEIRQIFQAYDTDGSGELDQGEFVEVLMTAGFSRREAEEVYGEVNTDGSDGVSLDEFECWWISTQRQQARKQRVTDMSNKGLAANVSAMVSYLEREELQEHTEVFRAFDARVAAGEALQPPTAMLAPPALQGEVQSILDSVALKTEAGELKAASKAMLELFNANWSLLDVNPNGLPEAGSDVREQAMVLAHYMAVAVALLRRQGPSHRRQADTLQTMMLQLKGGQLFARTGRGAVSNTNYLMDQSLLKHHLLLGREADDTLTRSRLQSAQLALSKYMASSRQATSKFGGPSTPVSSIAPASPRPPTSQVPAFVRRSSSMISASNPNLDLDLDLSFPRVSTAVPAARNSAPASITSPRSCPGTGAAPASGGVRNRMRSLFMELGLVKHHEANSATGSGAPPSKLTPRGSTRSPGRRDGDEPGPSRGGSPARLTPRTPITLMGSRHPSGTFPGLPTGTLHEQFARIGSSFGLGEPRAESPLRPWTHSPSLPLLSLEGNLLGKVLGATAHNLPSLAHKPPVPPDRSAGAVAAASLASPPLHLQQVPTPPATAPTRTLTGRLPARRSAPNFSAPTSRSGSANSSDQQI